MASSFELSRSRLGEAEYRTELASFDADTLSVAIVRGLAAVDETEPGDLDFQLYDYLDVDAIESMHGATEDANWQFDVAVEGRTVTVRSDGTLLVH